MQVAQESDHDLIYYVCPFSIDIILTMLRDIRTYFEILFKYLRGEGVYVFSSIVLGMIAELSTLAPPLLTKFLVDDILAKKDPSLFSLFLIASVILLVLLLTTSVGANYLMIRSLRKGGAKLRFDLFKHLQGVSLEFFCDATSGQVSYRILHDSQVIEDSWGRVASTLPLQALLFTGGLLMLFWHWQLAIFVFLILLLQAFIIVKFRKPLLRYAELSKQLGQELTGYSVEHFRRIQLVRSMATEKLEQISFFKRLHELVKVSLRAFMINQFSGISVLVVNNLWMFGILWYGGMAVIGEEISLGTLMAFLFFANVLYRPVSAITTLLLSFQEIRASLRRYLEYLSVKSAVIGVPSATRFHSTAGSIVIKNVFFAYNN